jgi:hypothetical protein
VQLAEHRLVEGAPRPVCGLRKLAKVAQDRPALRPLGLLA